MTDNDFRPNTRDVTLPYIDENADVAVVAALMIKLNAFVSIEVAERITTLDKSTQYRERLSGKFPPLVKLTPQGRRKAYRIVDLKRWLDDPQAYRQDDR